VKVGYEDAEYEQEEVRGKSFLEKITLAAVNKADAVHSFKNKSKKISIYRQIT